MESNELVSELTKELSGPAELHAQLVAEATERANSGDQTIAAHGRRDLQWLILLGQLFAPRSDGGVDKAFVDTIGSRFNAIEAKLADFVTHDTFATSLTDFGSKLDTVAEAAEGKETKVSADIKERLSQLEESFSADIAERNAAAKPAQA